MDPRRPSASSVWGLDGALHEASLGLQGERPAVGLAPPNYHQSEGRRLEAVVGRTFSASFMRSPPIRTRLTYQDEEDRYNGMEAMIGFDSNLGNQASVQDQNLATENLNQVHGDSRSPLVPGAAVRRRSACKQQASIQSCEQRKRRIEDIESCSNFQDAVYSPTDSNKRISTRSNSATRICRTSTPSSTQQDRTKTPNSAQQGRNGKSPLTSQINRSLQSPSSGQRGCPRTAKSPNATPRERSGKSPNSTQRARSGKSPSTAQRKNRGKTARSARRGQETTLSAPSAPATRTEIVLFEMHKKRKPEHWRFIQLVCKNECIGMNIKDLRSEHARCAYCNKCGEEIVFEKSNTAHVTRHMKKKHPKELKKAAEEEKARKQNSIQPLMHQDVGTLRKPVAVLPPATEEEQARADDLASIWIAKSMRPFTISMDKYFRKYARYLNTLQKRVKIIKPWKARAGVEVVAAQLRDVLKDKIAVQCMFYSASADIWSSKSKLGFICFTLHYLDEEFRMWSWVLEVRYLPGKPDGYRIAESLRAIMNEWGLPIEKCVKFLRDGASNGVKACELLNLDSMSCLAHSLHLIVGSGIVKKKSDKTSKAMMDAAKSDEDIDAALEQVACEEIDTFIEESCVAARADLDKLRRVVEIFRKLAVFFSRSVKALDCLRGLQTRVLVPQTDCATRWNSTHAMLLRMLELRTALVGFFGHVARTREFSDAKFEQPTAEHWLVIRCLVVLLEPFAEATVGLGGEKYPTLVMAVPVLRTIERKIKDEEMFEPITRSVGNEAFVPRVKTLMQSVRRTYVTLFTERFKEKLPTELLWISALDPRSAELKHLSHEEAKTAIARLKVAVFEMGKDIRATQSASEEDTRVVQDSSRPPSAAKKM